MAETDTSQEKTEQPTAKKLREAKQQGQIPRSKELNTMGVMLFGAVGLLMMGSFMLGSLGKMMTLGFTLSRAEVMDKASIFIRFENAIWHAFSGISPFLVLMTLVALMTPLILGGWAFSFDQIAFKLERMNPISGLKRIFSARGLMELLKALAKFFVVSVMAVLYMSTQSDEFFNLGREPFLQGLNHAAWLLGFGFLVISFSLVLIAAIDVPFQLWDHSKKLKMTLQEVRDEMKETEGRPEVKSKVRALQQEMAQRRMMEDVPTADVIITNPTHYSVALKYDPENMAVPVVVAMGKNLVALKIREIANEAGVEIFEAPPLARTLYAHCRLGQEIPGQLYYAVAQVLAFIFQLRQAREKGLEIPEQPEPFMSDDEIL